MTKNSLFLTHVNNKMTIGFEHNVHSYSTSIFPFYLQK